MLLPESIETLIVVRGGLQSIRSRQVFADYRRFMTGAKLSSRTQSDSGFRVQGSRFVLGSEFNVQGSERCTRNPEPRTNQNLEHEPEPAQDFFETIDPSPVRRRTAAPPAPSRPRTVRLPISPVTFESVMSCMRMLPSPVCASSSAPKPSGIDSVDRPVARA